MLQQTLQKKYNELDKLLQAYQAAVNVAAIVSITDLQGRIVYVNDKFLEVSKYSSRELIGKTHRIINSGYHPSEFFKEMWETVLQGVPWRGEIKNRAKDGSFFWVDTIITPMMDSNQEIRQFLSVRNLITVQKEQQEKMIAVHIELLKQQQQLKDAQQVAKTGSWYWIASPNLVEWSEETYRIYELPTDTVITDEMLIQKFHPDDRKKANDHWEEGIRTGYTEFEHRILTPSGEKWVMERGRFHVDPETNTVSAVGTVQDTTEKKKTEIILRESESLYKSLFDNSPFPVGIADKDTLRFLEVNEKGLELYGYTREEFLQMTAYDIRMPEDQTSLKKQLKHGSYISDHSIRSHVKKNGEVIQVEPFITEISYKGKPAFLVSLHDVTEKVLLQEQLVRSKINRQKEISRASMEAQERNRTEVGRELHDNVNQVLTAANIFLKNIQLESSENRKLVEKCVEGISTAINEIRKLSWSLVPPSLNDLSLEDSIENLVHNFELTGASVKFDIVIDEEKISQGLKTNIFRILQEQFSNIIKYAEATQIKITMRQQKELLTLEIKDNGKGFDPKQKSKGIGLTNITHRAEAYDGEVIIDSGPGKGCRIYIEFRL